MFRNCSALKSIDLSSFNTTNVNNMSYMFDNCSALKKENVKAYDKNILKKLKKYILKQKI